MGRGVGITRRVALILAVATALALSFTTAPAQSGGCTSVYTYHPVETPLKVAGDLTVKLRNPYGKTVNIGRYFVQFRILYASAADRARVASVQWALDGEVNKFKRGGGRDAYAFGSFHLSEGPHVIDVTITPTGGGPVTGHIRFTATGCAPMSFAANADHTRAPGHQPFALWVYSGAPMRRIQLGSRGAHISTAPALRGKKVGELRQGDAPNSPLALRLPTRWSNPHAITLLRHGGLRVVLDPSARRFLTVTDSTPDVTNISLSFGGPRVFAELPSDPGKPGHAGTPGLIGTQRRCQRPRWDAWVSGTTGPTVHTASPNSVYRACRS
jgi:hypothetical protein